jgi:hypothetical protein
MRPTAAAVHIHQLGARGRRGGADIRRKHAMADLGGPEKMAMPMRMGAANIDNFQEDDGGAVPLMVKMAMPLGAIPRPQPVAMRAAVNVLEDAEAFGEVAEPLPPVPPVAPALAAAEADIASPVQAMRMIMPQHMAKKRAGFIHEDRAPHHSSQPVIRVYAHQLKPNKQPNVRDDFTDTVYWNSGLRTNSNGIAEASFVLSDSITSFHVYADAFASLQNGVFGSSDHLIGTYISLPNSDE